MTIANQPAGNGQAQTADLGTVRDRVALVTGGTRGIGAAISGQLAGSGADVAAGYWRGRESAEKFHASMTADHPRAEDHRARREHRPPGRLPSRAA